MVCTLLMFLEVVEVFGDEGELNEKHEGREEASYICSGASCPVPPFLADMCPNPWSRRPSGVLTSP